MDLFKRKPKLNAITDVEVFEKEDKNFYEALLGEISSGSHDVKETVVTFPSRQVVVRSASGVIKSAYDSSLDLSLDSRFYWTENAQQNEADLKSLLTLTQSEVFDQYSSFVAAHPHLKDFLASALESYVISVIQKTVADFDSHEKVRTELVNENRAAKLVEDLDFFNESLESLRPQIERIAAREQSALTVLSIARFAPSEVKLAVDDDSYTPNSDAERFIFTAAENKATLKEVKQLSGGFVWAEVLEALVKLSESTVKVSYPGSDAALPEIFDLDNGASDLSQDYHEIENPFEDDEELEDKNSVLVVKPLEGIIVEPVNEPGEEYLFGSGIEEDDGSFMYEMLHDDDANFFTEGVSDSIEDDVRRVLSHESVPSRIKDEVVLYLRRNTTLEAELSSIEKSIADNRGHYNENVEVFEELKFQNNVLSAADDSEIGKESLKGLATINEKQDISNTSFFTVSKLEEERYKINVERRSVLTKTSILISELTDESVQGILHRIELKLQGIEKVTNVAFHAPEDDEDEHVDPSLLTDLTPERLAAKSKGFSFAETPMFFLLANELGYNPFELVAAA
jgi:hypothetical protein